jgi:hypothetical protein
MELVMPEDVLNLPQGRRYPRSDRRTFIGGSDVVIMGCDKTALRHWRERQIDPPDLSGQLQPTQPCDRAGAKPSPSPACAAHAAFVAALAGHPPRTIPLEADALDLEDRADHLNKVLTALSVSVAVILDDTAQNLPGTIDLPDIEAVLADLTSDVTGAIQQAAEDMGWRIA